MTAKYRVASEGPAGRRYPLGQPFTALAAARGVRDSAAAANPARNFRVQVLIDNVWEDYE